MDRKARRESRKAEKLAKLERRKEQALTESNKIPRTSLTILPELQKLPRTDTSLVLLTKEQKISLASKGSRFSLQMTWCARCGDVEGDWSWNEPRQWDETEWLYDIKAALDCLEGSTWAEIDAFSSDSGHKMHHGHELNDLRREARRRWKKLGYEEFGSVFRFSTGNTQRAWGVILQGHFYLVWFEREHKIYPVSTR
jgi:hypothetical protein